LACAVLTIGEKSYFFGQTLDARSAIWRGVPSKCGPGGIALNVSDGRGGTTVTVSVRPSQVRKPLTTDADYRTPLSLTSISAPADDNQFTITSAENFGLTTRAIFVVRSLTVKAADPDESNGAGEVKEQLK
jgi:hypothetical protein